MTNTSTAISGTVEIHGTAREELDSVWLELFQTFTISEIKFNTSTVDLLKSDSLYCDKVFIRVFAKRHYSWAICGLV